MKTLLEKAKTVPTRNGVDTSDQDAELAVAWAKGEIAQHQAIEAWGLKETNRASIYVKLALGLRKALELGLLKNGQ